MLGKTYGGLATKPSGRDVLPTCGGKSSNPPSIDTVKWANVDCDLMWFMASNVVHSTCYRKATHWLI